MDIYLMSNEKIYKSGFDPRGASSEDLSCGWGLVTVFQMAVCMYTARVAVCV